MITISIRWKVIFGIACLFMDHRWQEYTVIHAAWTPPGKYCQRCRKSITRRTDWRGTLPFPSTEEVQPWFSVRFS